MNRLILAGVVTALALVGGCTYTGRHVYRHDAPAVVLEPPSDHGYLEYYDGQRSDDYTVHEHHSR